MKIKQLFIKWRLWEEKIMRYDPVSVREDITDYANWVSKEWHEQALKHFCEPCNRWFSDVRGKLMHDRHRHKNI